MSVELGTVRGWLMDEAEKRTGKTKFTSWIESNSDDMKELFK
jgi:hypothetical protein